MSLSSIPGKIKEMVAGAEAAPRREIPATPLEQKVLDQPWLKIPYAETVVRGKPLRYVQTNRMSTKRVETLLQKEPTTIPWLDLMQPGDVLVDIGANVGMYSIYAAKVSGATVYGFEPESLNYAELNKNIYLNELHGQVMAYCLALSNENKVDRLLLGGFAEGLSHHDFGENTWVVDKDFGAIKTSKDQRLPQGCVSFTLDSLVASGSVPMPKFVKIDVDGIEGKVVEGCWQTFSRPELESVLIEVDHRIPSSLAIVEKMLSAGWRYSMDQVRANRKVIFTEEQIRRMQREGQGGFNYIFYRDAKYDRLFADFMSTYVPPWAHKVKSK